MRVALVYDRVNSRGGAEQVLLALHQLWPEAPLFTSVYDPKIATWAHDFDVKVSFLQRLPGASTHHQLLAPLMPYAFESLDLGDFEVIISVTSAEAKGVITHPHQLHVCYLLTPSRYLWHMANQFSGAGWKKALRLPWLSRLRQWDQVASTRPDVLIAISKAVARRSLKYYQRQADAIIYPGIDWQFFAQSSPETAIKKDFFLMVGRLVEYKRFDWVLKIFKESLPARKLVIVGTGKAQKKWQKFATENIIFTDYVSREQLREYYSQALALIFPQEEDFGLIPVEAQATGTPVLAYGEGGALETVVEGKTGLFFNNYDENEFINRLEDMENTIWHSTIIQNHVRKFDITNFQASFTNSIEELWQQTSKQ